MTKKKDNSKIKTVLVGTRILREDSPLIANRFWERRTKHGRDKLFSTPEVLWEAACEYFESVVENPWYKRELKVVDKSVEDHDVPTATPFTMTGLCFYLGVTESYFRAFKSADRKNSEGFVTVISRIQQIIYDQQYNGAAVGAFNGNIISRALGLVDKAENVNTNFNVTPSADEIKEIRKSLNKKL